MERKLPHPFPSWPSLLDPPALREEYDIGGRGGISSYRRDPKWLEDFELGYSKKQEHASLHLKYPGPPGYDDDLIIRRGDMITMSLLIPYNQFGTHASVKCVEIPFVPRRAEHAKPPCRLILKMELWDVPRPYDFFLDTTSIHDLSPITAAGSPCGCVIRFHGRDFAIKEEVELCLEFPIIANGCKKHKKFEIVINLISTSGQQDFFEELTFPYTLVVLSSAKARQSEATPPIPTHFWRLLLSHARPGTSFPRPLPTPFDHTLAKGLGLDRHCVPLLLTLSSHEFLGMVYHLSHTKRQLLLNKFLDEFVHYRVLFRGNLKKLESLQEQYDMARLIATLQAPIMYLPVELLTEVFLISVGQLGVSQSTLQLVCKTWRSLVTRLWGVVRVSTWTETQPIRAIIERNPSYMTVVIDTSMDETLSVPLARPYAAFALAWTSASRWKSLTINSLPGITSTLDSSTTLSTRVLLENLEFLAVGPDCNSSGHINIILEAISSNATPKLTYLILAAPTVIRRLNPSQWAHIYSQLTVLEVEIMDTAGPVDLLRHCVRLEELKLSGVVSHHLLPQDELRLVQTLRQLWLRRSSIQWMMGRTFQRLDGCMLLKPVDVHTINQTDVVCLPSCSSIMLQSQLIGTLAVFHAPVVNKIVIECNQWTKVRANLELGRVWSRRYGHGILQPRVLFLKMLCGDRPLLGALQQMVVLEELILDVPHPGALGAYFFEAMCAVPTNSFTGKTIGEWEEWTQSESTWQARICPCLVKLQLRYERWLRKGEMDVATPQFIAVTWSRGKLPFPLQQFNLKLGEGELLQLVGMTDRGIIFKCLWGCEKVWADFCHSLYIGSITSVINRCIVFPTLFSGSPFEALGQQYYSSLFRHIRAFRYRSFWSSHRSYNVLPFFEHLEELDVSNLHFESCPPAAGLPLCRTLRILYIKRTHLDWMDGRTFERVTECMIGVYDNEHVSRLHRVEMPACKKMDIVGLEYLKVLESFQFPRPNLLHLGLPRRDGPLTLAQDMVLLELIQSIRPRVLQICMEDKLKAHFLTWWLRIGKGVVEECQKCWHPESELLGLWTS